jgi:hypothetical protein
MIISYVSDNEYHLMHPVSCSFFSFTIFSDDLVFRQKLRDNIQQGKIKY